MTIQEKKSYLKQYKRAVQKIKILEKELENLRYSAMPGGIDYSKDKIQTTPTNDQMINYVIKVEDLAKSIMDLRIKAVELSINIIDYIASLDNDTYQTILHRRYILLESWEEIASEMDYSVQWVYLTHGEALAELPLPKV